MIQYRRRGIGTLLLAKSEDTIHERCEVAGLDIGLLSDYGAAQSLYIIRGYVPDGKGIYKNGKYLKCG
ncbi:N-acetyltransferase [Paenibacillus glacialis]|uniref:N-acetyltransferase domain-containing protein n=1 Tax=Paenibacillus glacialis TaxID=494026 RepID=A0A168M9U8_9BACL|nr:N-acetyltransferase [Paenibacillus glacialis]OAB44417.1 hypothetical protein PGLA_07120 [Paenibacillus glacialis]